MDHLHCCNPGEDEISSCGHLESRSIKWVGNKMWSLNYNMQSGDMQGKGTDREEQKGRKKKGRERERMMFAEREDGGREEGKHERWERKEICQYLKNISW